MATILFNAFSFLQKKLKSQLRPYANVRIEVADGATVRDLVAGMGLEPGDIEAVFINGCVEPIDSLLHHGDRVAIVPPGTPGPYRVLLGMLGKPKTLK
ncbi:MAG: MoaD/ThiS family protein [Desulfobacterales bacterium]|nr:MoaD/ThiS family protein [Desulfobacterales bacterium]